MPYPGIPAGKKTTQMEICVANLESQGKTKNQAIAICHASIMGEEHSITITAGLNLVPATEQDLVNVDLTAEQKEGRILKFKDAIVARCEINKNDDGFTADGLKELAATLPMMPLHVDHEIKRIMGVFTAARTEDWVREDGLLISDGNLVTEGIIFAQDWPEETNEVISGERKLSIEADASRAVFHIDKDTGKQTRYLFGFTATGAGTTKDPAGYNTVFDTEKGLLLIARVTEEIEVGEGEEAEIEAKRQRSPVWYMVRDAYLRDYDSNASIDDIDVDIPNNCVTIEGGGGLFKIDYQVTSEGNVAFSENREAVRKEYVPTIAPYLPITSTQASVQQTEETMPEKDEVQELKDQITALEASIKELKDSMEKLEGTNQELTAEADKVQPLEAQVKEANEKIEKHGEQLEQKDTEAKEQAKLAASRAIKLIPSLGEKRVEELVSELSGMDENAFNLVAEVADKNKTVATSVSVGDVSEEESNEETIQDVFGGG